MPTPRGPESRGARAYDEALASLDRSARRLGLDDDLYRALATPWRSAVAPVPGHWEQGTTEIARGFQVHHNAARGPARGRILFHRSVDLLEVTARAMWTTWQHAVIGIPFGGAAGGLTIDLAGFTEGARWKAEQRYGAALRRLVSDGAADPADLLRAWPRPDDRPGPHRGMSRKAAGQASCSAGVSPSYTDHPSAWGATLAGIGDLFSAGGSRITDVGAECAARGIAVATVDALHTVGIAPDGARVAVRGIGAVSAAAMRHLTRAGCTVVAVSDLPPGHPRAPGFDWADAIRASVHGVLLSGNGAAEPLPDEELLAMPVDVLVIAAAADFLPADHVRRIKARIVIEGAPMALDARADEVLADRGATVVPDTVACAGEAIHSYLAWVRRLRSYSWDAAEIHRRLREMLTDALHGVRATAGERRVSLRQAAHLIGVDRVAQARARHEFDPSCRRNAPECDQMIR